MRDSIPIIKGFSSIAGRPVHYGSLMQRGTVQDPCHEDCSHVRHLRSPLQLRYYLWPCISGEIGSNGFDIMLTGMVTGLYTTVALANKSKAAYGHAVERMLVFRTCIATVAECTAQPVGWVVELGGP